MADKTYIQDLAEVAREASRTHGYHILSEERATLVAVAILDRLDEDVRNLVYIGDDDEPRKNMR